jgi:uncharacterized protein
MKGALIAGIAMLAASFDAAAASFDCAKASTPIEKMICSDQKVSELDGQLAQAYRSALGRSASPEATKAAQKAWLTGERNRCADVACLKLAYQRRIEALAGARTGAAPSFTQAPFISPRIVDDLSIGEADQGDNIIAINLTDAQGSNRYFGDVKTRKLRDRAGPYVYTVPDSGDTEDKSEFGYSFVGRTQSGIDVLMTSESGGGTGVFENLLLVKVDYESSGSELLPTNGKTEVMTFKKRRLVIRKLGEIGLGDRWQGDLKVTGNQIEIGKDVGIQADADAQSRVVKVDFWPSPAQR